MSVHCYCRHNAQKSQAGAAVGYGNTSARIRFCPRGRTSFDLYFLKDEQIMQKKNMKPFGYFSGYFHVPEAGFLYGSGKPDVG